MKTFSLIFVSNILLYPKLFIVNDPSNVVSKFLEKLKLGKITSYLSLSFFLLKSS